MKKMSVKLMSLLITVLLCLSVFNVGSFASFFLITATTKIEGDTLILSIYGSKAVYMPTAEFTISYDNTALKPEKQKLYMWSADAKTEEYPIKVSVFEPEDHDDKRNILDIIFKITDNTVSEFKFNINGTIHQYDAADNKVEIPFLYAVSQENENYEPPEKPEAMRKMGDVDNSGLVDAADARSVLRNAVGLEELSDIDRCYASMDYDENIDSGDARTVLRTAVGLESVAEHSFVEDKNGRFVCSSCGKVSGIKKAVAVHKHSIVSGLCTSCGEISDKSAFEKVLAEAVANAAVGHMIDAKNTRLYQDTKPYDYKIILLDYLVLENGKVCVCLHYNIHYRGFNYDGLIYSKEFYDQVAYVTYDFTTKELSSLKIGEIMLYDDFYVRGPLSGSYYIVPSVLYFETSTTGWKAMSADAAKICDEKTQTILKTEYYAYYAGI